MQKLFAYVDESGQDTNGTLFVVGVVLLEDERDSILKELERIEDESGKNNIKWHKARRAFREDYIRGIAQSTRFENTLFFETFGESKEYLEMTSYAAAKAIIKKAGEQEYRVVVYVDGLSKTDVSYFGQELKALNIKRRKVRGGYGAMKIMPLSDWLMPYAVSCAMRKTIIQSPLNYFVFYRKRKWLPPSKNANAPFRGYCLSRITAGDPPYGRCSADLLCVHNSISSMIEMCQHSVGFLLFVSDVGVGTAQETLPHLFQKFSRAEDARPHTKRRRGKGGDICGGVAECVNTR